MNPEGAQAKSPAAPKATPAKKKTPVKEEKVKGEEGVSEKVKGEKESPTTVTPRKRTVKDEEEDGAGFDPVSSDEEEDVKPLKKGKKVVK